MTLHIHRKKLWIILLVEAGILLIFVLVMRWLWDRWLIEGPNGLMRWVGMDFVPYWVGVRSMWHGQSPYTEVVTQAIQAILLGGPPGPGGDPMLFVYPAWIFLPLTPLVLLPLPWAAALWTGFLLWGMLHLVAYLAYRWGGGSFAHTLLWAVVLTIGSLPYMAISVTKGQLGLLSMAALLGAFLLRKRREFLSGCILALAVLKPTLTVIPTLGFLLWALIERKGRLLVGFGAALGVLLLSSLAAVGFWIPAYMGVLGNTGGAPILWSLSILPFPLNGLFTLFFIGLCAVAFINLIRRRDLTQWFPASVLAGLALFPMRWIYDLLLGILVPVEARNIRGIFSFVTILALLMPWVLAFLPPSLRWDAQVIILPLLWAVVFLVQFFFRKAD
jgi:hypothetical protein